ncbi:hypothetical protein [Sporosarcina sp. NPDC096371]|uniref:hypothetical protein n=1 Tax=Sporosarcina sp. NPDC096371 TaxID=3364530 RepID=UPI00380D0532
MKTFLRLNMLSALYAFVLFISVELQVNFYRIWRLTGWESWTVDRITTAIHIIGFIVTIFLFYSLVRKWFEGRIMVYWSVILWLPYVILFVFIFATLFPMTDRGDSAAPVTGLIIIGQLMIYPFYLAAITWFGSARDFVVEEIKSEK